MGMLLFFFAILKSDSQFSISENKSSSKRKGALRFASGLRGSRALTGLKGTAVVCQDSNGSQRPSCQSELLLCSLWCFSAALTLWLVYLSTMMAEG